MYTLAILIYALGVRIAALFYRKARLLIDGQARTFGLLRDKLEPGRRYVWFHAASLGEFEQGRMLMETIRREHPSYGILLTFFSPSGYEVRKDYEGADIVCYLPFDTCRNARRFVEMVKPEMVFFVKYEFWAHYIREINRSGAPLYSVASIFRTDQVFFKWYGANYAHVLKLFTHFFVQNENSRQLLASIGVADATVVGDTRFDRVIEIRDNAAEVPLAAAFADGSQEAHILVAGSTWPPDEQIIIDHFNSQPRLRLVLAPHVVSDEHLAQIEARLKRPSVRLSQADADSVRHADCLIIDGYGLLASIYRYGHIAYVGGGFGVSVHNVPEAAVYGMPVIVGPNNKKFREVQDLMQLGGTFEINSADDYARLMARLMDDSRFLAQSGQSARDYIQQGNGAVAKIYETLDFRD